MKKVSRRVVTVINAVIVVTGVVVVSDVVFVAAVVVTIVFVLYTATVTTERFFPVNDLIC